MEHGRTARRYRFLIPAQGSGYVGTLVINLFIAMLVCGVCVGMVVAARAGLHNVFSSQSVLYRLTRPLTEAERAEGRVRGAGVFRAPDSMGLCLAEHQHYVSGKNGGWRTDGGYWIGNHVTFDQGAETWEVGLSGVVFDPYEWSIADAEMEAYFRGVVSFQVGGRVVFACARPGQAAFVEGCASGGGRLGPCSDGANTVITLGDGSPRPRIRKHASETAAQLGEVNGLLAQMKGKKTKETTP